MKAVGAACKDLAGLLDKPRGRTAGKIDSANVTTASFATVSASNVPALPMACR